MKISDNIVIYARQSDVTTFYNSASLVLNLSDKERIVETFGLTALEAMSAGLPIIVPTVGGIAEMVEDGVNGYKIDVQELDKIKNEISDILTNKDLYLHLSHNALARSEHYNFSAMVDNIISCIEK